MLVLGRNALGERGVSHAFGMSRKGGGIWIPRLARMMLDWQKDRYFGGKPEFSRNSRAWDFDANGNLYEAAAGIPRRVNGRGILLEPQHTNQIRNASASGGVAGSPGSLPTNWSTSGGSGGVATGITRTLSFGTMNGLPGMFIRFEGTASNGPAVGYNFDGLSQVAVAAGQTWSGTAYIALAAGSLDTVTNITFRSTRGSSSAGGTTGDTGQTQIKDQVDGVLRRFGGPNTIADANTAFAIPQLLIQFTAGNTYDFTLFIAAPSFTQAGYASSPILSGTNALTRAADFLRFETVDGGRAFFFDFDLVEPLAGSASRRVVSFGASVGNEIRIILNSTGTATLSAAVGSVAAGSTVNINSPVETRKIVYGCFMEGYARMGFVGGQDSQVSSAVGVPAGIHKMAFAGQPHASGNNTSLIARKFAEAGISEFASPAEAFDWAKEEAMKWAA